MVWSLDGLEAVFFLTLDNSDMNPNFKVVGEAFVKLYYDTFDNNRGALAPLYVSLFMNVEPFLNQCLQLSVVNSALFYVTKYKFEALASFEAA